MTLKKIDAAIVLVAKSGEAFNVLVHETIIAILEHAQEHGDCSRALALVMAMPKSVKRSAVVNSFADYSPIGMNVNAGRYGFHKAGTKAFREFNIDGYRANPWFARAEVQKDDVPNTLADVEKAILSLVTRFQNKLDEGKVVANDKAAVVARLAKLAA